MLLAGSSHTLLWLCKSHIFAHTGPATSPLAQVHLSLAGPGAVTVSWVTWAQEDPAAGYDAARAKLRLTASALDAESDRQAAVLVASRKLRMADSLGRHHHHHHRHRHHDTDDDASGHCDTLRDLGLRSVVEWGTASGELAATATGGFDCYSTPAFDSGALHHVVIGDAEGPLPPNATIYYRVGDPSRDEWSPEHSFRSPPAVGAASLPYRLGLVGDLGQTEHSLTTLEHVSAVAPDSYMFVGDLSYADGFQPRWDTWGRMMAPLTAAAVWMFTEGNHEREPTNGAPDFLAYTTRFRVPSAAAGSGSPLYYSYDVAGAHIVMLGSYADTDRDSAQFAWLESDLAGVDRRRTPWVIVGMHAPWYNSNHNHYGEGDEMRDSMEAVLYQHGVDLVVSGHVHAYERSFPTYDGEPDPCGPIHVNVGDGGNREGLDFEYFEQPEWSAYREPSYGAGVLDLVNATHAQLTWHRNQDGIGEVGDSVVLQRDPECRRDGLARLQAKAKLSL